ncbi:Sigma-70, region 4 [Pricia antarctica]|uniref:Sigma-70, region 4 n=1 Tax=Pricia antarctica TaxID=641691 RepID=A0A1G6VNC3_9FLAO|nr:sigma factor-like helix-turn-helix DNA-binding protein [Pricia antarctica]SDD55041.1 Sigma-70, region 4 [Pricia antarctica]
MGKGEFEQSITFNLVEALNYTYNTIVVIILFYLKGYSQREISDRLNIPLGTVKTRKRSGILKLRGFLERESSGRAAKAVDGNR